MTCCIDRTLIDWTCLICFLLFIYSVSAVRTEIGIIIDFSAAVLTIHDKTLLTFYIVIQNIVECKTYQDVLYYIDLINKLTVDNTSMNRRGKSSYKYCKVQNINLKRKDFCLFKEVFFLLFFIRSFRTTI